MDAGRLNMPFKRWNKASSPKRVLAIRLQAMGDTIITLPYLNDLRRNLPLGTELDLLTRKEVEAIPKQLDLFDHVYSIGGRRNWKKQLVYTILMLPKLLLRRYHVVIDLQNNNLSKLVRKSIKPGAWSEFDRFSPVPAGECTRLAVEATGLSKCSANSNFSFKTIDASNVNLLKTNGWDGESSLVVLNPAGAFPTRNWPIENYVDFARIWLLHHPKTQFVTIGIAFINDKASYLKQQLGERLISLVNKTSSVEAFRLLEHIELVLSEDSGLMHMAWVRGVPTLALFGSTRSDRATPLGRHSLLLNSSDLSCGDCMLQRCIHHDNRCLTRYTPQFVFEKAVALVDKQPITSERNFALDGQ